MKSKLLLLQPGTMQTTAKRMLQTTVLSCRPGRGVSRVALMPSTDISMGILTVL